MIRWRPETGDIILVGACGDDDAEPLLELLLTHPRAAIDWRDCVAAHTCIVQLLLAAGRPLLGPPKDPFLTRWVEPHLAAR